MSKGITITFDITEEEAQELEKVVATIQLYGILDGYKAIPGAEFTPSLIAKFALHHLVTSIQKSEGLGTEDK